MAKIIFIETSTELCSTALSEDGRLTDYRESGGNRVHASMTAVFIDEMLRERGLAVADCDAVCVSAGPGSYTGLRVGVSTAKGLCFGAGIPLLAVGTLDTLVWQALSGSSAAAGDTYKYIVPMIDARRMEVYTAVFRPEATPAHDPDGTPAPGIGVTRLAGPEAKIITPAPAVGVTRLTEPEAKIIDADSFADLLEEGPVLFVGDAADKCSKVLTHPNARFINCNPKASSMLVPAMRAYEEKRFEDVAYFEPLYVKNFVPTVSRKKIF